MNTRISRVRRSKAQAKASYNQMSRWYDLVAGNTERKYREVGLELLDVKEGERALEIGYGTGHCLLALAGAVGESGGVFGIDLSEGMHAITQKRIQEAGLESRVDLMVGDVAEQGLEILDLDVVFMSFTLELFDTPEIPTVLQKCYQVLRPGGRICVVSLVKRERDNLMVRLYEWFHEVMPGYADCRPIYAREALVEARFRVGTVKAMSMWGLPVEVILAYRALQP